ncbi:MAG: hypothetical protein QOI09_1254, partial [Chloroflexota bacterium]|nr:hypothetical protein [Chloroflexota bacterium]
MFRGLDRLKRGPPVRLPSMASVITAARWLLITVIAATATATPATAAATPATAAAPVADIPFGIATDQLFDEARNDGRQGEQGQWQLLHGRLRADALDLTFKIEPPRVRLPVQPGPAVLYGGLHLFGDAGGDVATGQWVDSLVAVTLPPCANPAC